MLETEREEAAYQGNLQELQLSGKLGKPGRQVKDKGRKPIPDNQNTRGVEHSEELTLNFLSDIKYEAHVCKSSQDKRLIFLSQFKYSWCLYLWKVHEKQALVSRRM